MKSRFYYTIVGMIMGIGFKELGNQLDLLALPTSSAGMWAAIIYLIIGFSLYYYDDEIKARLGVT